MDEPSWNRTNANGAKHISSMFHFPNGVCKEVAASVAVCQSATKVGDPIESGSPHRRLSSPPKSRPKFSANIFNGDRMEDRFEAVRSLWEPSDCRRWRCLRASTNPAEIPGEVNAS